MSVLLPSTTVFVLSSETVEDAHGHRIATGWVQRGPFPAHRSGFGPSEELTGIARSTEVQTVIVDSAAWPVRPTDRIVDVGTDEVLEVTGAQLVNDLGGAAIGHVRVRTLYVGPLSDLAVVDGQPVQIVLGGS